MSERADLIAARDVLDAIDAQTHKGAGLDPHPDEKWSVALTARQWAALAQAFDNIVWSVSLSGRENEELKSERADLIAAKERLTKSAAISTMATSGRSRSYDGHQMQMVRLEDLRLLLASGEVEVEELELALEDALSAMKAATVYVLSKERIKQREGDEWWNEQLRRVQFALDRLNGEGR